MSDGGISLFKVYKYYIYIINRAFNITDVIVLLSKSTIKLLEGDISNPYNNFLKMRSSTYSKA